MLWEQLGLEEMPIEVLSSKRDSEGMCGSEGGFSTEVSETRLCRRESTVLPGMSSDSPELSTDVSDTCKRRRRAGL